MHYYLIHGLERKRRIFMEAQLRHSRISKNEVTWINHPNKDEPLPKDICINPTVTLGQLAVTYKHYLALKDIVEKQHKLAVIMEDNIEFLSPIPEKINEYLSQLPEDWDILFDSDFFGWRFIESATRSGQLVYKKKHEVTTQCAGASKGAHFYLLNYDSAKKLLSKFLPISDVSDYFLNHLIREMQLNAYWADPPNIHKIQRKSTWI